MREIGLLRCLVQYIVSIESPSEGHLEKAEVTQTFILVSLYYLVLVTIATLIGLSQLCPAFESAAKLKLPQAQAN